MNHPIKISLEELYNDGIGLASAAVEADTSGDLSTAQAYYYEAAQTMLRIIQVETNSNKKTSVKNKALSYVERAEQLKRQLGSKKLGGGELSLVENKIQQAQFSLKQAQWHDARKNWTEAVFLYDAAAEGLLSIFKDLTVPSLKTQFRGQVSEILERIGEIKEIMKMSSASTLEPVSTTSTTNLRNPSPNRAQSVATSSNASLQNNASSFSSASSGTNRPKLTSQELEVLRKTSYVNNRAYLPWLELDLNERFYYPDLFTDPDGVLKLSARQTSRFGGWKRPCQFMAAPKMIHLVSSTNIVQDVVTDCSFVASLCVSSAYERRFRKNLITSCIYPQDKNGQPLYNPSGKYMIKLIYNGISRKIGMREPLALIDDLLPISKDGTLMCTYSTNRNELWSSIIEKAYMKLMGGYDFPGSNSGIDLYALTGWIPEHVFIREKSFNADTQWQRLLDGCLYGDALITIATGEMSESEAETLGLVPTHAYALLDLREIGGLRLMQVKNPWSHKRWKGPFSHLDTKNWTPELKRELNYDQLGAMQNDDGIFWIDFESVCSKFDSIHLNWNPELFKYRYVLHVSWPAEDGPIRDNYNLGFNPQYGLEVNVEDARQDAVWLLLSKHITVTEENTDYIALHVYENTNCERVYYPDKPMIQGVYINSPHILIRFKAPIGKSRYTIVVSQHQKRKTLNFSLRAYGLSTFKIGEIPRKYSEEQRISTSWTAETAGGSLAHPTYLNNPNYKIVIPSSDSKSNGKCSLFAMIEAPRTHPANLKLIGGGTRVTSVAKDTVATSGDYRHGFCYLEANDLPPGPYTIICSTFDAGLEGSFFLTVRCTCKFQMGRIPLEGEGMQRKVIQSEWVKGLNGMGSALHKQYGQNPRFSIDVPAPTYVLIRLQTPITKPPPPINVTIFQRGADTKSTGPEITTSGPYTNVVQGVATEKVLLQPGDQGYVAIFSTWDPMDAPFVAYVYSSAPIMLQAVGS
ncbi:hypothetical protein SmJEL517_g03958 [Synchytrium microbalum]|uniref:Calpain catalytic domain-containing protein n=1 Tax=Synchytrium microbalum TaxID=1806994 RepID=A0A507BWB0_9FUNG|nr:uncharacterized protein SmJEL517_g03958 [Synchytrium microbalum]TPX33127.1 hypothetical protein SmJEL517_g03958 [Synchytrium microbalum]